MTQRMVTLISSDSCQFDIPIKSAILSKLAIDTLDLNELHDNDNDDNDIEIDSEDTKKLELYCLNVDGITLERISKFLVHYSDNPYERITIDTSTNNDNTSTTLRPLPIIKSTFEECIQPDNDNFYNNFINEVNSTSSTTTASTASTSEYTVTISDDVYTLKHAANYMHIDVLLELIHIFQTCQIQKCTSTEEIMSILRIPSFIDNDITGTTSDEEEFYRTECPWMFRFRHTHHTTTRTDTTNNSDTD